MLSSPADRAASAQRGAKALADEGADVAISYSASADKAEAVVRDLKAKGVKAKAFKADQGKTAEVDQLVRDVAKEFGHLDILVNNAAVAVNGTVDDPNSDGCGFRAPERDQR